MKIVAVGFAATLFSTSAMATAVETQTTTFPCRWVVDVHTTLIHGRPQEGYTISEPRCEPIRVPSPQGLGYMSDTITSGKLVIFGDLNERRLSDITVGCLKAILAEAISDSEWLSDHSECRQ